MNRGMESELKIELFRQLSDCTRTLRKVETVLEELDLDSRLYANHLIQSDYEKLKTGIQETREQMNVISDFCHQNCRSMEKETGAAEKTKEKSNRRSGCDRIGVESDE